MSPPHLRSQGGYCSAFNGTYASSTHCEGAGAVPNQREQALRYAALVEAFRGQWPWAVTCDRGR